MAEMCTWIIFRAHPTKFVKKEDSHPDFFGVFVCPVLRSEPEQLLGEVLRNRKLVLVDIGDHKSVSKEADWGMNERLKGQLDEQGYGLSLTKMHAKPIEFD